MSVIWKGPTGLREVSQRITERSFEKQSDEYIYEGTYAACLAGQPVINSLYNGTPFAIVKVRVERLTGGRGRLTLSTEFLNYLPSPPAIPPNTNYEIVWCREDRDLLTHPLFMPGGLNDLTAFSEDNNYAAIEAWRNEPNVTIKGAFKYHVDSSDRDSQVNELSMEAQAFCEYLLKGISSYMHFYPVARRTTKLGTPSAGDPCGFLTSVPFPVPPGYDWIKTADDSTRAGNGKWQRSEEWTGSPAGTVDPLLYEEGSVGLVRAAIGIARRSGRMAAAGQPPRAAVTPRRAAAVTSPKVTSLKPPP